MPNQVQFDFFVMSYNEVSEKKKILNDNYFGAIFEVEVLIKF